MSWNQVLNASVPGDTVGAEQITLNAGHYSVLTGELGGAIDISLHDLHAAGDLDGNSVQDEVGILVSTVGDQLRTESIVGFVAAAGAPAATSAYPLPAGYRIEGLSVADDDVVITYAAPRLEDSTYDEVQAVGVESRGQRLRRGRPDRGTHCDGPARAAGRRGR